MLFRKCGCLVAHEKYIFRKCFSIWPCVGCKMVSAFILPSNIIFRKTKRERVRVRSHPRAKREKGRREPIADDPRASTSLATQRLHTTNPWTSLRLRLHAQSPNHATNPEPSTQSQSLRPTNLRPRAFNFAGNPEPSTSPETHKPISLRVRFWFLCDFDFFCCCGGVGGVF